MNRVQTSDHAVTLIESGLLTAQSMDHTDGSAGARSGAAIHRGMSVQTSEGDTAGRVAAVVLDEEQQKVTHILLMQERQLVEYRLVPVELIAVVEQEAVLLYILHPVVKNLPIWHGA